MPEYIRLKADSYRAYIIIVLMGFTISFLLTSPLVTALSNDKEIFRYIAMLVSKGFVPYRDAFEQRPPIIFFLGALFAGSGWSFWLLFSTIVTISGVAFYKIAISVRSRCPYLCVAIYFLLLRWPRIAEGGQLAYELTAAFATIITLLYVFRKNYSLILLGVLSAIVFFTQQNDVLCLLPVIFYAIITRGIGKYNHRHEQIKIFAIDCVLVFLGFISIALIISLYFLYRGAFQEFIYDTFIFSFYSYIGSSDVHTIGAMLFRTSRLLLWTGILPVSLMVVIFNAYFVMRSKFGNRKIRDAVIVTTIAMILAIISANISGRYYPHYLLGYSAFLAIQIAAFTSFFDNKKLYRLLSYVLPLIIIAMSLFSFWVNKENDLQKQGMVFHNTRDKISAIYYSATHNILEPYESMVADMKGKDGQLYIIGNIHMGILSMNTDLKIVAPSKWFGDISMFPDALMANGGFESIVIDRIEQNKTKYILDFSDDTTFRSSERAMLWKRMLNKKYIKKTSIIWDGKEGWLYVRYFNR